MGSKQHLQKTVLVVEDMTLIRMDAVAMFEDMGYRVLEAEEGLQALAILESTDAVSLLFTDIEMPRMDGLELAAVVAARWPRIEIVITSGRVAPRDTDLPDAARFVPKPYDPHVIAKVSETI